MKSQTIIIPILLLVVVAGGAFFAGMKYDQSRRSTFARQAGNSTLGQRGGMMGGNRAGLRPVTGTIVSSDQNTLTVKLFEGSSRIVLLTDKTTINKAAEGTKEDLKAGETVAVNGTDNADGTVTAQNIQLNPVVRALPTVTPKQ